MKSVALAFIATAAVLFGGSAFGKSGNFAKVTLYDGDPATRGRVLATATMGDGPVAKRLLGTGDGDARVRYVTLEIGGQVYTAKCFPGGASKNSIYMDVGGVDRADAMTLGEMLREIAKDPNVLAQL